MHTCHRQLVVLGILEEILACFHGNFLIHIIGSAVFRMLQLKGRTMDEVTNHQ